MIVYTAHFSEFSYAYSMTDNILHSGLPLSGKAPIFPSLQAEGSSGGGYDVKIPIRQVALFLQFKIPQIVYRHSAKKPTAFDLPYLRIHLRTKRPNQHQLLLDLERSHKLTYYTAPLFWKTNDLDRLFSNIRVPQDSVYILPSTIGTLDDRPHHIAYHRNEPFFWRFSESKHIEKKIGIEKLIEDIDSEILKAKTQEPLVFLNDIADSISEIAKAKRLKAEEPLKRISSEVIRVAQEIYDISHIHFGCTFIVIGEKR